jgi:hypothetical protein
MIGDMELQSAKTYEDLLPELRNYIMLIMAKIRRRREAALLVFQNTPGGASHVSFGDVLSSSGTNPTGQIVMVHRPQSGS